MVCSERFNRFEELYPVYKNEFKINIESHGDLRDKLNSIYIHTEGVVDGLKTAGAKILEVIKTIWKKIKEVFSKIFGNKQKQLEQELQVVEQAEKVPEPEKVQGVDYIVKDKVKAAKFLMENPNKQQTVDSDFVALKQINEKKYRESKKCC